VFPSFSMKYIDYEISIAGITRDEENDDGKKRVY
jgi:hypothetical protein